MKAVQLNSVWHSRLPECHGAQMGGHLVCFGAEFEGQFFAIAIWTDPIARLLNGRNWLELRRMAIAENSPKNTASRMIRIMAMLIAKKWPSIVKLISYQDCDVHTGTIYKASGWTKGAENRSGDWIRKNRDRRTAQAPGKKIRWEFDLARR